MNEWKAIKLYQNLNKILTPAFINPNYCVVTWTSLRYLKLALKIPRYMYNIAYICPYKYT